MLTRTRLLVALGLALVTTPALAQDDNFWQNKWFWGAQGGSYLFKAGGNTEAAISAGGHWFVTAGRSALLLGFDQLFLTTTAATTLSNGRQVQFDRAQRIQATVYAMPSVSDLHIFLGGGFAIQHVTDAEPMGPFATPSELATAQNQVDDLSTKAFAVLGGGVQWHWLDRWAVFGQYQYMPGSNDFLITSAQHTVFGGLRFALTTSKEQISTN